MLCTWVSDLICLMWFSERGRNCFMLMALIVQHSSDNSSTLGYHGGFESKLYKAIAFKLKIKWFIPASSLGLSLFLLPHWQIAFFLLLAQQNGWVIKKKSLKNNMKTCISFLSILFYCPSSVNPSVTEPWNQIHESGLSSS